MLKLLVTIVAFIFVSFTVQGLSHFVINIEHFAAIDFTRPDPIFAMGFAAMIIQALVFYFVMTNWFADRVTVKDGIKVSLVFGLFLAAYIVLAEPAKYAAPSVTSWVLVEATASTIQFGIFGILLGLIHRR